jgi:hypothetical protein
MIFLDPLKSTVMDFLRGLRIAKKTSNNQMFSYHDQQRQEHHTMQTSLPMTHRARKSQ